MDPRCFAGCSNCSVVDPVVEQAIEAMRALAEGLTLGRIVNGTLTGSQVAFDLSNTGWRNTGLVSANPEGEMVMDGGATVRTEWRDLHVSWTARRDDGGPTITSIEPAEIPAPDTPGEFHEDVFRITGGNFQGANVFVDGPLVVVGDPRTNSDGSIIERDLSIGCCEPLNNWIGRVFNVFVSTPFGSDQVQVRIVGP
jgi:hypothetical protein